VVSDFHPRPSRDGKVADLSTLSREELAHRWQAFYGTQPLPTLTKDLLVRGIAYEIQVRQQGGLRPSEVKALWALAQGNSAGAELKPGTRLYRTWQGTTHEVLVLESGFAWQGKGYSSLSEVARAITGTRWSGPRFFGLSR